MTEAPGKPNIQETESSFEGVGGLKLYTKTWQPGRRSPVAVLVIVHGVGEHIGRYQNLVDCLVPAGIVLNGYDQRGFGRSEGKRGHINTWDEYRQDLKAFVDRTTHQHPGLPIFVYGHSMGSLVVLDYLIDHPAGLSGAILSGTAIDPADAAPPHLKLVAKILSGLSPRYTLVMKLEGNTLSRDPYVARAYNDDPLVHYDRTTRWGTEGMNTIKRIEANPGKISLPVLFVHGELDPLVTAAGARSYYEKIASPDKTLKIYQDGLHEPHNDIDHEKVIADIREWIEARLLKNSLPKIEPNRVSTT
jgi:alpha-beta hydrolase superfamily lysophospholipase